MTIVKRIVLFDGICNLCSGIVQYIIMRDPEGKIKFASLQSEIGQKILREFGFSTNHFDTFIYIKGNKCFSKSTAALQLLKDLGGICQIAYMFILIPRSWRDPIYDIFARMRYRISGKKDFCVVSIRGVDDRFLK